MTMPVPAHEQQTGAPAAAPAAGPADYREVDANTYHAAQQAAATPTPAPAQQQPAEPPGAHNDALRAEVATELDQPDPGYPDGAIAVRLEGEGGRFGVVHILPPDEWPSDANSAMHVGDYESWADGCLAGDDYEKVWADLRPRMRNVNAMFEEYQRLTGQDQGKSVQSPRSLRNSARRSRRT